MKKGKKSVKKECEVTFIGNIKPINILKPNFKFQEDKDNYDAE